MTAWLRDGARWARRKRAPTGSSGWCSVAINPSSTLLRGSLLGEVVVVGHAPRDVVVEIPLHSTLGKRALRFHDLLEQRVVAGLLLDRRVVRLVLFLQDRIGR